MTKKLEQARARLERLELEKRQAKARLQKIEAREKERARRGETRRNVILGATIRAALEHGERVELSGDVRDWLRGRLTRKQDRQAWGLDDEKTDE